MFEGTRHGTDGRFGLLQGFFVAMLYCFMNGEVQQELVKIWRTRVVSGHDASRPCTHSLTFHSVVAHSLPHSSRVAGRERRPSGQSVMSDGKDDNYDKRDGEMLELNVVSLNDRDS